MKTKREILEAVFKRTTYITSPDCSLIYRIQFFRYLPNEDIEGLDSFVPEVTHVYISAILGMDMEFEIKDVEVAKDNCGWYMLINSDRWYFLNYVDDIGSW